MKQLKIRILGLCLISVFPGISAGQRTGAQERSIWVNTLAKIAEPVLVNLSQNTLRKNMPVEVIEKAKGKNREAVTHLEAIGRLLYGISPWLELGPDNTTEGQLRKHFIDLTLKGLHNAVDPDSPDRLNFTTDAQALVDAAFLAQGLLRAPTQIWEKLDKITQNRIIEALKSTRIIKPNESNWLLFSATIESAILQFTGECQQETITYALTRMDQWYKGDGWYGDGKDLHLDYYNSIVIHPMMMDIMTLLKNRNRIDTVTYNKELKRSIRYATELERLISPEGTYPAIGRSLTYRFGIFQALTQVALKKNLPAYILPSQVRSALTVVIERQMNAPGTFDSNGWLTLGFCGHQPEMAETYISTGSLYMCAAVFLPLGLPETDEFWTGNYAEWTNKKAWNGVNIPRDHAIND
jgi:hypothetical protein